MLSAPSTLFGVPIEGSNKRARSASFGGHTKRPIDKQLIVVSKDGVGSTQSTTTLLTVTFPCTIVGLRWTMSMLQDAGTGASHFFWAIMIVKDGVTIPVLAVTDAGDFVTPEQNVMAYGNGSIDNNSTTWGVIGSTKTMRKLMGGDLLVFVFRGIATNTVAVRGVVQFFCKT